MSDSQHPAQRVRVEQGIYQQPNGKYAVCFMVEGKPSFRTVGYDLDAARIERAGYIDATRWGIVLAAPRLRFAQGRWLVGGALRAPGGRSRRATRAHPRVAD